MIANSIGGPKLLKKVLMMGFWLYGSKCVCKHLLWRSGNSSGQDSSWLMFQRFSDRSPRVDQHRTRSPQQQFAKRSSLFQMPLAEPSEENWNIPNKLHTQIIGLPCSVGVTTECCWFKQAQLWSLALLPQLWYF